MRLPDHLGVDDVGYLDRWGRPRDDTDSRPQQRTVSLSEAAPPANAALTTVVETWR